jgi:hypothetical protein
LKIKVKNPIGGGGRQPSSIWRFNLTNPRQSAPGIHVK